MKFVLMQALLVSFSALAQTGTTEVAPAATTTQNKAETPAAGGTMKTEHKPTKNHKKKKHS